MAALPFPLILCGCDLAHYDYMSPENYDGKFLEQNNLIMTTNETAASSIGIPQEKNSFIVSMTEIGI